MSQAFRCGLTLASAMRRPVFVMINSASPRFDATPVVELMIFALHFVAGKFIAGNHNGKVCASQTRDFCPFFQGFDEFGRFANISLTGPAETSSTSRKFPQTQSRPHWPFMQNDTGKPQTIANRAPGMSLAFSTAVEIRAADCADERITR